MNTDTVNPEEKILESKRDDQNSLGRGPTSRTTKSTCRRRTKRQRSDIVSSSSSASHLVTNPQQPTIDTESNSSPQNPLPCARVVPLLLDGKALTGCPPRWIRIIDPYPHTFISFAKQRWIGRSILDVYATEFGSYPESYYRTAIQQGRIVVCGQTVSPNYTIQRTDILQHTVHRHEPAVYVSKSSLPFVNIVTETDDCLVVDKPGSMPIHPCGGYHLNSLMPLLEESRRTTTTNNNNKLYTIHRLDRLTSGLVVLGKSSSVASQWAQSIQSRDCQKLYLAQVQGKFPQQVASQPQLAQVRLDQNSGINESNNTVILPQNGEWPQQSELQESLRQRNAYGWWITNVHDVARPNVSLDDLLNNTHEHNAVTDWLTALEAIQEDGHTKPQDDNSATKNNIATEPQVPPSKKLYWIHLACPTRVVEPKNGVCACGTFDELSEDLYAQTVKAAQTSFAVLYYDVTSDSTILLCRPQTGRTHQIRIHLQHLGHSIANDPNYGGTMWYGNPHGKDICERAQELLNDSNGDHITTSCASSDVTFNPTSGLVTSDQPASEQEVEQCASIARIEDETLDEFIQRTCVWCARNPSGRDDRAALELLVRSSGIWLHALQYSVVINSQRVTFRTDLPEWATAQQSQSIRCLD